MAVTFASAGYGGAVTQESWASLAAQLGHTYAIDGDRSWEVTPGVGDRAVVISPGRGYGHGVMDSTDDSEPLFIPAVTTGTVRYDLIVARRDWSTKSTTFGIVAGGAARALPARAENPGFLDEQPLALVRVAAGSTAIQEIVDVRLWGSDGGMFAKNDLVRSYIKQIGAQINIAGVIWSLQIGSDGIVDWVIQSQIGRIPLFAPHGELNGGRPAAGAQFLIQTGTFVNTTDGDGYSRLTFPKPFPNGLLSVLATNGDDWALQSGGTTFAASGNPAHGASALGSRTDWVYVVHGFVNGNNDGPVIRKTYVQHRINYIAIGW